MKNQSLQKERRLVFRMFPVMASTILGACQAEIRVFETVQQSSSSDSAVSSSSSSTTAGGGDAGNGGAGGMLETTASGGSAGSGAMGGMGSAGGGGSGGTPFVCNPGERDCVGDVPRECNAMGAWVELPTCAGETPLCVQGVCAIEWSCSFANPGTNMECGLFGSADCCGNAAVPAGTFSRSNDPNASATVSSFKLDLYEVTIGRFRAFVDRGYGTQAKPPPVGSGNHPTIANSGWDSTWNTQLAVDSNKLRSSLACNPGYPTWTDAPTNFEYMPMACVTWFEAFAFCAWDGGRLPTEAEWNYAAAGGNEQRIYPWGSGINNDNAVYDCFGDGFGPQDCALGDILPVGQKILGDGRWGHSDLAGSVWELVLDAYALYPKPCSDCASIGTAASPRTSRGGAFNSGELVLSTIERNAASPLTRDSAIGFRCARD